MNVLIDFNRSKPDAQERDWSHVFDSDILRLRTLVTNPSLTRRVTVKNDEPTMSIPYKGIIPPLATPLSDIDTIDIGALERLIQHLIDGGVHGIFLLGTSGEGPSLSPDCRRTMILEATRIIDRRLPVLVGISDTSKTESLKMAQFAADCGADAVVSAGPFYMPPSPDQVAPYFSSIADESPLPVIVYNIPICTGELFTVDSVKRLLDHQNVIGIKDSAGDMSRFNRLIELTHIREDFTVLMGPEDLTAQAVMMGAHGAVCGGANLLPELFVAVYEAAVCADLNDVQRLQVKVHELAQQVYSFDTGVSGFLRGLKCALSCIGLCENVLSAPYEPLDENAQQEIKRRLVESFDLETVAV